MTHAQNFEGANPAADWLDVGSVIQGSAPAEKTVLYTYEDVPSEGAFRCVWHIERRAGGFAVEGHLNGDLSLICDDCQQSFLQPIAIGIDELYVLSQYAEQSQGREKELQSEDFYEVVEQNGKIDLKDLAHQYLVIETTHNPTCGQPPCPSAANAS